MEAVSCAPALPMPDYGFLAPGENVSAARHIRSACQKYPLAVPAFPWPLPRPPGREIGCKSVQAVLPRRRSGTLDLAHTLQNLRALHRHAQAYPDSRLAALFG